MTYCPNCSSETVLATVEAIDGSVMVIDHCPHCGDETNVIDLL